MVRRVAEYKIRSTIRRIVINLLATKFFGGFLIQKTNRSKTMKSKIFITGAVLCAITTGAHAVTKCVALNSSNTTCSYKSPGDNITDWTSTCTTNGVSTPIKGIGICSSTNGGAKGATATELEVSSATDKNLHCWCRMISPAASRWVFNYSETVAAYCARYCTDSCALNVREDASFRSALFGSLSD